MLSLFLELKFLNVCEILEGMKWYTVWAGHNTGVFDSWSECRKQIAGFPKALYKSFSTKEEATAAYNDSPFNYMGEPGVHVQSRNSGVVKVKPIKSPEELPAGINPNSIAVDAACSGNPGRMEYRGVYLGNFQELFHFGPVFGTNNIGEFLAIVHALAYCKQNNYNFTIYSDSRNAINWVKRGVCATKLEYNASTAQVHDLIGRAEKWLASNRYTTPVVKWETEQLGEIPADFGRK